MSKINFKFKKIRDVNTPTRGTALSAGLDFYVPNDYDIMQLRILPHQDLLIHSGIMVDMMSQPVAFVAMNKSGVVSSRTAKNRANIPQKKEDHCGSIVVGACVVDSDYQGEIMLHVINTSDYTIMIHPGEKIAQFLAVPVYFPEMIETDMLFESPTDRGDGKMGSTDK